MNLKRIGLVGVAMHGRDAGVLRGFLRYAQNRASWLVYDGEEQGASWLDHVRGHHLDGIAANIATAQDAETLRGLNIPVVNTSRITAESRDFATVDVAPSSVAVTAARHFLERGFSNFAFFDPFPGCLFMAERGAAFRDYLADKGHECAVYENFVPFPTYASRDVLTDLDQPIVEWLQQLPKPTGIFAGMDHAGRKLCWICNLVGIHVPEDVAILGVDNFDFVCETSYPQLSSVRVPSEKIGYVAAELLDGMLHGITPTPTLQLLPADGVVTRQSTDITATRDRKVAAAMQFIRTHFVERITVADVARFSGMHRRTIERRFRAALHRTPLDEIHRLMVARASRILRDTDASVALTATVTGFRDSNHMFMVFRSVTGKAPSAFRHKREVQRNRSGRTRQDR